MREDYSADGSAWSYFPHEHARSRAYRWGEDGLLGISDSRQRLCFAPALWNGRDPFLKERLFGVTGEEGNHGEDVKELYYYLDATPSHSYMRALYKYPQAEFPYARLVEASRERGREDPEPELLDTGLFDDDRYFDVEVEYAKAAPDDLLIRITAHNRGPDPAPLWLLPQLWFRNTWSWGRDATRPELRAESDGTLSTTHSGLGRMHLACDGAPEWLFCENESNGPRLWGSSWTGGAGPFKDAFHDYVVGGDASALGGAGAGTKAAALRRADVAVGASFRVRLRLSARKAAAPFGDFDEVFRRRIAEADAFHAEVGARLEDDDARRVQRQALAGVLWTKQYYGYDVAQWLEGDPAGPPPPESRKSGRNADWLHLANADVVSMPDKWEYPWYAAWDLAFHCIPLAMVDPELAKQQLVLFTREWYLHPNGQMPAYEWAFDDVNPPVHAWGAWRVYKLDRKANGGKGDLDFLERVFHKLLLNFTWWVNRKDVHGHNLFQGGFLGLDNIGVFDRSAPLPTGGHIEQADGTSWMAMYCLNLMRIALELCDRSPVYQDVASKFFEHFLYVAAAMNNIHGRHVGLWDEEDEFFYDVLHATSDDGGPIGRMKVRSLVGLTPLFAVETLEPDLLERVPDFAKRLEWFLEHRPGLANLISRWSEPGLGDRRLLSLLRGHRFKCLLRRMLDETEFLSDHGVRALSRHHLEHPYRLELGGRTFTVRYEPGESESGMFGGNSNWRGPIWFPMNFLIIESLQKFHHYYGDDFRVECPTGSGNLVTIAEVAEELTRRLNRLFLRGADGRRPVFGADEKHQSDPHFRDCLLFHEYFHGDTGRGVGASHQTGWTALVAKLLVPRRD